ncbi:hypothetical protein [Kitasatospora sp. NPDC054795]
MPPTSLPATSSGGHAYGRAALSGDLDEVVQVEGARHPCLVHQDGGGGGERDDALARLVGDVDVRLHRDGVRYLLAHNSGGHFGTAEAVTNPLLEFTGPSRR